LQKHLKPIRRVISIAMLVAIGFLFLDFSGAVPSSWFKGLTWLQFVPSLMHFCQTLGHGLAVTAYGFVVVLVLSLLFGRVYCSYLCPLGILMDLLSWVSAKVHLIRKKKLRFRFAPPKTSLRYSIFIVVCLSLFTGNIFLINLLEPYSNFGRFVSDLLRPLYMLGNNIFVRVFEALGSYALYPITVAKTHPLALLLPSGMLALVIWLSLRRGRLYCNTVCPVGTLLGLLSKASLYKIKFDAKECNRCGNCVFVCKSQCIDLKKKEIDFSRCVGCGNCLGACDKTGIRYALGFSAKPKEKAEHATQPSPPHTLAQHTLAQHNLTDGQPADASKRCFVLGSAFSIAALGGLSAKALAQNLPQERSEGEAKGCEKGCSKIEVVATRVATPPGSRNQNHFAGACTACHLCVSACPSGVLKPSLFEYGFWGMLQPFMDYNAKFCNYECTRCTEVCPTGAILPLTVEQKLTTQIGIVRFERENCVVVTAGTSCGACSEHCPTKAVTMVPHEGELTIPEINPDICIGCGACEYACPVTPYKAIVVDGLLEHKQAQKPTTEQLKEKPREDFAF